MSSVGSNGRVYDPDRWVMLRYPEGELTVLGGWYGGYLDGDSWRRSTPAQNVVLEEDGWMLVHNLSGSVYRVQEEAYGTTGTTAAIAESLKPYDIEALSKEEALLLLSRLTYESSESQVQSELPFS